MLSAECHLRFALFTALLLPILSAAALRVPLQLSPRPRSNAGYDRLRPRDQVPLGAAKSGDEPHEDIDVIEHCHGLPSKV
jgi:hypothetical protein